ncbi:MAG: recombinase family protein [Albidovulum sp.]|nr:recombinase family protein [Albidovulum sp.]
MAWRSRNIADVLDELREGDALIFGEHSRLGRSMLGCVEILSIASDAGIRVYAIKGCWKLDETIQSRIIVMAFSIAAEIERDLISARTKEAIKARKASGLPLGWTKGPSKSKLDRFPFGDRGADCERINP